MSEISTILDALAAKLTNAGLFNSNDQVAPAAILWPDKDRQWEALLPELRNRLPILTLGAYAPAQRTGPAYWIRCMLAYTLLDDQLPSNAVPIIYLPDVSRQEIRAVEECPKPLQPLAELQYRGVLWTQKNGRDWTIAAFLQNRDGGLDIPVSADNTTKEALLRALPILANEPLEQLRKEAPVRASYLDELLNPDEVRRILLWMNDPKGYQERMKGPTWSAFCNLCQRNYSLHPEKDGPVTAAQKLGQNQGPWQIVWQRFCEAPTGYPNIPALLRKARASIRPTLFERLQPYWPQDNEAAEAVLREQLSTLHNALPAEARTRIQQWEEEHSERRRWVWAKRGEAPLAEALACLVVLAQQSEQWQGGGTIAQIAAAYTENGWRVDAAVIDALAAVKRNEDVHAVKAALRALYRPWLEQAAQALQQAVFSNPTQKYLATALPKPDTGTCILFTDALRFDLGQRLIALFQQQELLCSSGWRLAALPTVTPTAKPAVAPIAAHFAGHGSVHLSPVTVDTASTVTANVLRNVLATAGYQVLSPNELGDPTGLAWTELGAIDQYGHQNGSKLAHRIEEEIQLLHERVTVLLDHGWRQIIIVTDHGWLLLPGNLPKVDLPLHVAHLRKGRCAVLKEGAVTNQQTIAWHWDPNVRIAIAPDIRCFEEGKEYEHGGISPQECIVPVITVTTGAPTAAPVIIENINWKRLRCNVQLSSFTPDMKVDIRTQAGNSASSLVSSPKSLEPSGSVSLVVEDEDRTGFGAIVVVLSADGIIRAQMSTIVGG
jgi:hypothetical protein